MIERYQRTGYIKSRKMAEAVLRVPREHFMDPNYMEHAYVDQPFPIPGDGGQTISAPYMYPIFYEPLDIREGYKILEIGAGSGYGAALARELVGEKGLVVTIEINESTYEFASRNLEKTGYDDVKLICGDGSIGYPDEAPYDAICVTAASPRVPYHLIEQMKAPGKLMVPVGDAYNMFGQDLVLLSKEMDGSTKEVNLMKVAYVPLRGKHGQYR
ncbi:MAG: protein-L-isoaspartate O-methyltransferase [Candidatus Thorarchaeota archaeon]